MVCLIVTTCILNLVFIKGLLNISTYLLGGAAVVEEHTDLKFTWNDLQQQVLLPTYISNGHCVYNEIIVLGNKWINRIIVCSQNYFD